MKILRSDNSIIKKRKINLKKLEAYNEKKINIAIKYLNEEIQNNFVSHFDYISYVLEEKNRFSFYNKNTGCINDCKRLKKKLNELGLKTYFISCKANGFSNPAGDSLVKEAHVFLLYPSLKDGKIYFTIFDPGFRITNPISFYNQQDSYEIPYLSTGKVKAHFIENTLDYPYELIVNKRINYKHEIADANIHWKFNPYYETIDINDYNEKLYAAMFSLKLMNYPNDINKYICIRSKILEKTIEIYTIKDEKIYFFEQLSKLSEKEIKNIFKEYFLQANLSIKKLNKFVKNIFLLVNNTDIYIKKVIDSKVIEEYKSGHKLNR